MIESVFNLGWGSCMHLFALDGDAKFGGGGYTSMMYSTKL